MSFLKPELSDYLPPESVKQKAARLLNDQLKSLEVIRGLRYNDPHFDAWRDSTTSLLKRFLPPDSPHLGTFTSISFSAHLYATSAEHQESYFKGCKAAAATIRAVLMEIEEFGVHEQRPKERGAEGPSGPGVQQNFHGPVTIQNQAIATDQAIQNIGHMGDATGTSLREIAEVFKNSGELRQREVKEGLAAIEGMAVEMQKPETKRDWKSVLGYGQTILAIIDKATDLGYKLTPYLSTISSLVHHAKQMA
jgi:hypothetical protein